MIRKSLKYLLIVGINALVLLALSALSIDELDLKISPNIQQGYIFNVTLYSLIILVLLRVAVAVFKKMNLSATKRFHFTILLAIFFSSTLYFEFGYKFITSKITQTELRENLINKVESNGHSMPRLHGAKNLTSSEFNAIARAAGFQEIPSEAYEIFYSYYADGFLPDYAFVLNYSVPKNIEIEPYNIKEGSYYNEQRVSIEGDKKIVSHNEGQM